MVKSWKYGQLALRDDPWGHGNSLEWATSSPPPRHNFVEIPRIRSERPAFELHYPHLLERLQAEAHAGKRHEPYASELVVRHRSRGRERTTPTRPDRTRTRLRHHERPRVQRPAPERARRRPEVRHHDRVPLDPTPRSRLAPATPAPQAVLTVTGADRPGVTARLFAALPAADGAPAVEVLDVEQVVVHGHLVLGVVVGALAGGGATPGRRGRAAGPPEPLAAEVGAATGMSVQVESAARPRAGRRPGRAARTT